MHIYAGFKDDEEIKFSPISIDDPTLLPNAIANLQQIAQNQHDHSMRVDIFIAVEDLYFKYAENIDIDRLLSLDLNIMKDSEIY
jgi:hypothetical protein